MDADALDPQLRIETLRGELATLEDLIITSLAQRQLFPYNTSIYVSGQFPPFTDSIAGELVTSSPP